MAIRTYYINASKKLSPFIDPIEKEVEKIIDRVEEKIPLNNIDIIFFDHRDMSSYAGVDKNTGIGGFTGSMNVVQISLDTSFKTLNESIEIELFPTLAHELHHATRWQKPGYGNTLFEALITEGLAAHFEENISNIRKDHWYRKLNKKELEEHLSKAKSEFKNKKYSHSDWFFGSEKKAIPPHTGYSLGYYLVNRYVINNPKQTAASLVHSSAQIFLP